MCPSHLFTIGVVGRMSRADFHLAVSLQCAARFWYRAGFFGYDLCYLVFDFSVFARYGSLPSLSLALCPADPPGSESGAFWVIPPLLLRHRSVPSCCYVLFLPITAPR